MDISLVEGEEAVERGKNVPEDETGNIVAGLRFLRQGLQGESRSFAVVLPHLGDPPFQIGKGSAVRRAYHTYRQILDTRQGGEKTLQGMEVGGNQIGAEVRRDVGQDVIPRDQETLLRQVERDMAAAVPRSRDDLYRPAPDGELIAVGEDPRGAERRCGRPESGKSPNHRIDRPVVETVLQGEAPDARGAILLLGKGPDRQLFNLRQVNRRAGTARDDAGQAAVVHVKMSDPDPSAILHPPPDLRERGLQRRQDPVQVGTGVDQRETALFRE